MGIGKRMQQEDDERRHAVLQLCIEAGSVSECEYHSGTYFDGGESVQAAYDLTKKQFFAGETYGFKNVGDLLALVKDVYDDNSGAEECPACGRIRDSD
ncbi:TPA: hypothetical protein QDB14_002551 [Burkholderia vietnamiensis]|nr:hypothetical protein [Burkholderia vietnamiensis]HEP6274481.1 hypothetical protein [Burkholderia vietnamiensis]HEP6283980.1 hypothetical protein [Burkholderia vietnamiensis]HEP6309446.1 hypothetical protein [Burkholderia vietnamiensis]